ncbi:hypothetical protein PsorP6_008665 [Peronosclerospora sorghi]|uniref:Uncharacterized protein n=1 Tax=Peronosclerospora sorghi TaxID=230839 RepID=A0ACC0WAU7_9STRA|nr:hypothetical protein PsorP6_008665 [Peronosclerospora sorghi]
MRRKTSACVNESAVVGDMRFRSNKSSWQTDACDKSSKMSSAETNCFRHAPRRALRAHDTSASSSVCSSSCFCSYTSRIRLAPTTPVLRVQPSALQLSVPRRRCTFYNTPGPMKAMAFLEPLHPAERHGSRRGSSQTCENLIRFCP